MSQVISPQTTGELEQIFRTATGNGQPVYVYRKNNNPSEKMGGVHVDLAKLNKIIEIDTANLVATVEAGVNLGTLAGELTKSGLRFIPADTPFYFEKTVGQLFYEGCGNISGLKYGSGKHFLMGSMVVLPTGEILKTGGKTVKNVTGYDFTRFFNSPYTDLGVTAEFLLKLLPLPETRMDIAIEFKKAEDILDFASDMKNQQINPSYLIWIDPIVKNIFSSCNEDEKGKKNHLVIMQFEGLAEDADEQYQTSLNFLNRRRGIIISPDGNCSEAENWRILYNSNYEDRYVLTDELKMPFTAQKDFLNTFYGIAEQFGIKAGLFGHLAEGRLNMAFWKTNPKNDASFIDEVIKAAISAGGVASGKYDYLTGRRKNDKLTELSQRAKLAFDPKLILNRSGGETIG